MPRGGWPAVTARGWERGDPRSSRHRIWPHDQACAASAQRMADSGSFRRVQGDGHDPARRPHMVRGTRAGARAAEATSPPPRPAATSRAALWLLCCRHTRVQASISVPHGDTRADGGHARHLRVGPGDRCPSEEQGGRWGYRGPCSQGRVPWTHGRDLGMSRGGGRDSASGTAGHSAFKSKSNVKALSQHPVFLKR